MKGNHRGFIHLYLILIPVVIALGISGFIVYKNSTQTENNGESGTSETTSVQKADPVVNSNTSDKPLFPIDAVPPETDKINWVVHDSQKGFSLKLPDTWYVIYATSEDYIEMDIHDPDANHFMLIAIRSDEQIRNESDISIAIAKAQSTGSALTHENAKVLDFKSTVHGNSGSYVTIGEEPYFMLEGNKSLEELAVTTYNFQERGLYEVGKKTVILHGITLPENQKGSVITKIMDSFELN